MAMENKRIIQLSTERTTLGDDDYTIVDSDTNGTAKYRLSRLKETDTTLSVSGMAADAASTGQAISDEAEARAGAVTAEAQARQQAIATESQVRQAADIALGEDISDLKSAISSVEGYTENLLKLIHAFEADSQYYKELDEALSTTKKYVLVYTFTTGASYTLQTATLGQASSVVDTLCTDKQIDAGDYYVYDYTPSASGIDNFRCVPNNSWALKVYEVIELDDVAEKADIIDGAIGYQYVDLDMELSIQNGFYSESSGNKWFESDNARRTAIVNVNPGEKYRISTFLRPVSIPGVVFYNDNTYVSKILDGTGSDVTYTDYEFTVPSGVNNMAVNSANTTPPVLVFEKYVPTPKYGNDLYVGYTSRRIIHLGSEESASTVTTGTNWTDNGDGSYTHGSGSTSPLQILYNLSLNDIYWLSFDVSYTAGECVLAHIGAGKNVECYNGDNHVEIALPASGNTLYFEPLDVTFTISNVKLQKIQDTGTEKAIRYDCLLIKGHENNYGYWNTFIAPSSAENAISTTRSIAIGNNALYALLAGHRNIGIGTFAFSSMTEGKENVAIGSDSAYQVKGGEGNVYIGMAAGSYGTTNNDNVAIGRRAMQNPGNGDKNILRNVSIGNNSGLYTYGSDNVFIGYQAGYRNQAGKNNVVIGSNSLWSNGGDKNTIVGSEVYTSTASLEKSIGLGHAAIPTKSQQMVLGSDEITEVVMCGNKKIVFNNDGTVTWEAVT